MRTNAITTVLSQRRGVRNWAKAAALLFILSMAGAVWAQATNTIYQDAFRRTGLLNGSTPSPVDTSNATWYAFSQLITNGSEIAVTNASPSGGNYNNAFLPFTPQLGHVYTLSVGVEGTSGGVWWLAFGFAQNAIINNWYAAANISVGWLLQRANAQQAQAFLGPGTGNQLSNVAEGGNTNDFITFSIVLDTTTGNASSGWTATFYTNGVQVAQGVYASNPSIQYVGVGADSATGYYQNFTLTDYASTPQLTLIHAGANAILTWATNAVGFTLQSTTNLVSPAWTAVSPPAIPVNGQNTVTNPISATRQFYRLTTQMPPPAGFTASQLIFDDPFTGTALDTSKWVTFLGAQGSRWNNHGALPSPFSGPNTPVSNEIAMFGPSQVRVNNGLTLTAARNTNTYASDYPWLSGVVSSEGKFSLPATGWFVQVQAQMPDTSVGMWPAIWFMPDTASSPVPELDGHEGGFTGSGFPINQAGHSDYFSPQGQQQSLWNAGVDLSAGFHIYGFQCVPGAGGSITAYLDGKQVWQVAAPKVTIVGGTYELLLELEVAGPDAQGWHTAASATTPGAAMRVAEVQVYSCP